MKRTLWSLVALAAVALWLGWSVGERKRASARDGLEQASARDVGGASPGGVDEVLAVPREAEGAQRMALESGTGDALLSVRMHPSGCASEESPSLRLHRPGEQGALPPLADGRSWRLPPGPYALRVEGSGWQVGVERLEIARGAQAVEHVLQLEPVSRVRGLVTDASGAALPRGFSVQAETRLATTPTVTTRFHGSQAFSGTDFCLEALPLAPQLRLHIRSEGHETLATPWMELARHPFHEGLAFALQRCADVQAEVRGRLIASAEPAGLADIEVRLLDAGVALGELVELDGALVGSGLEPEQDDPRWRTRTTVDGAFSLRVPAPCRVRLVVSHPRFRLAASEPLELVPGAVVQHDLVLERGASITGQVRMLAEQLARQRPELVYVRGAGRMVAVGLDAAGRYEVAGLDAGAYVLTLSGEHLAASGTHLPLASRAVVLADQQQAEVDFDLASEAGGALIQGRALLPEGAHRWPVFVGLLGPSVDVGVVRSSTVGADGRFELHSVPDGEYLLVIAGQDGVQRQLCAHCVTVRIGPGEALHELSLDLTASSLVLRASPEPGPTGEVAIELGAREVDPRFASLFALQFRITLGQEGRFVLHGLPPGRYFAKAAGADMAGEARVEGPGQVLLRVP